MNSSFQKRKKDTGIIPYPETIEKPIELEQLPITPYVA